MKKILGIIFLCIFLSNHLQADIVDKLNKLNDLFKAGVISKEEFTKGKSIILKTEETANKKEISKKKIINKKTEKRKELITQTQKTTETIKEVKKEIKKRSVEEVKQGIFLDDLDQIGSFKEINYAPEGMFPEKADNFYKKQIISQKQFIKTFVTQKGLMEKYTDRVILGMAHFEFFYMQQLKENKNSIEKFKDSYPHLSVVVRKEMKTIYGLSKAKKSMREAVGLSLNDDVGKCSPGAS